MSLQGIFDPMVRAYYRNQYLDADAYQSGYDSGLATGKAEGKKEEYDTFWDTYQNNGKRRDYVSAFRGSMWNNNIFKPKYDIRPVGSLNAQSMFAQSDIPDLAGVLESQGVVLDVSGTDGIIQMFQSAEVKHIPALDLRNATNNNNYAFGSGCSVETIDKLIVSENTVFSNTTFNGDKLENIIFEGTIGVSINFSVCPLSTQSVQSIIDHLKDRSGLETQTLTFRSDVGAGLTETQRATITAKNWTLVY